MNSFGNKAYIPSPIKSQQQCLEWKGIQKLTRILFILHHTLYQKHTMEETVYLSCIHEARRKEGVGCWEGVQSPFEGPIDHIPSLKDKWTLK